MSNTPSDAEIIMLAVESGVSVRTGKGAVKLARAVLAKWGTPQPTAAEFALQALVAAGHVSQELVDKALTLPGAPQPVVREPLTPERIEEICADLRNTVGCNNTTLARAIEAEARRDALEDAARVCESEWSNAAEKLYGIECAAAIRKLKEDS